MTAPRILCLGNPYASDDGAALHALEGIGLGVTPVGRPGVGLLDMLEGDRPVLLLDVTCSGAPAGSIHRALLQRVSAAAVASADVSSHGFGPAEALRLGAALGRPLPPGEFVGVEGAFFGPGQDLSPPVQGALPELRRVIRQVITDWS